MTARTWISKTTIPVPLRRTSCPRWWPRFSPQPGVLCPALYRAFCKIPPSLAAHTQVTRPPRASTRGPHRSLSCPLPIATADVDRPSRRSTGEPIQTIALPAGACRALPLPATTHLSLWGVSLVLLLSRQRHFQQRRLLPQSKCRLPTPPVTKTRIVASTHARADRLQHAWLEQQAIRSLCCANVESRRGSDYVDKYIHDHSFIAD